MANRPLAFKLIITAMFYMTRAQPMILRNNALMNKMVSHFQKDNYLSLEQKMHKEYDDVESSQKPEKVMSLMQNVLCRNFPAIPCKMITEDETLKKLIEKSIQQIKYKTLSLDKTTAAPGYHLTLFPTINSEDLSNYLQVRSPALKGFYDKRDAKDGDVMYKSKPNKDQVNYWSQERQPQKSAKKKKKESKRTAVYTGRKKLRKFYPHKVKYKDKPKNAPRKDFGDYSEEKLSMSVEIPDANMIKRHQHLTYKVEPADPPVWRIDYMKHGEPSLNNMFGYEDDRLKGKLMKAGPSVIVDENLLEQGARKDVMHPDVYIKKNYKRKTAVDMNSEGIE